MRWEGREKSKKVIDRRGVSGKKIGAGLGLGTIIIALVALLLGGDPSQIIEQLASGAVQTEQTSGQVQGARPDDELAEFVKVVLKDTEDVWYRLFKEQLGRAYQAPELVLFSGSDQSACGFAQAATGPFYCPADRRVYIDLSFYQMLSDRFKAPGDFAMAYVVAHEVAHHVQNLLGILGEVHQARGRVPKDEYNDLSVRLELQADFFAGVWAHHGQKMKNFLEEGDIEEALRAASAIGDDRIQMETQGYVVPDAFTHGTSDQRQRWFYKGLKTGALSDGDTFGANPL